MHEIDGQSCEVKKAFSKSDMDKAGGGRSRGGRGGPRGGRGRGLLLMVACS